MKNKINNETAKIYKKIKYKVYEKWINNNKYLK